MSGGPKKIHNKKNATFYIFIYYKLLRKLKIVGYFSLYKHCCKLYEYEIFLEGLILYYLYYKYRYGDKVDNVW